MTPSLIAVTLFAGWAVLLIAILFVYRLIRVLGGKPVNAWTRGNPVDDAPFIVRVSHAHLNTLENLPVFAAIVLAGILSGQGAALDPLAPWVFYARIAQTATHLIGTTPALVLVRATFFGVQFILFIVMLFTLLL